MRTLLEFQNEVLAPLRKERDEKMTANYQKMSEAESAAAKARKQCDEDRREFLKKQSAERQAFENQLEARRTEIYLELSRAMGQVKIERRNINEDYNNKLCLACSEYNKDRVAAGEAPLIFFPKKALEKKEESTDEEENEE